MPWKDPFGQNVPANFVTQNPGSPGIGVDNRTGFPVSLTYDETTAYDPSTGVYTTGSTSETSKQVLEIAQATVNGGAQVLGAILPGLMRQRQPAAFMPPVSSGGLGIVGWLGLGALGLGGLYLIFGRKR